jgi:hypothetical protein
MDADGDVAHRGERADHDERKPAAPLDRGALVLRHLEGAEDASPQLERMIDRLHPGGILGKLGMAEIRLTRPRGHDQAVVGDLCAAVERVHHERAGADVDIHHLAQQHRGVRLVAEDVASRRRDLTLRQDVRRHLVEERLEEVMVGPVDDRHLDIRSPQGLGGEQAREAGADDRDAMGHVPASHRTILRSFTAIA